MSTWRNSKEVWLDDPAERRIADLQLSLILPRHFPQYATPTMDQIIEQCWTECYPWEFSR